MSKQRVRWLLMIPLALLASILIYAAVGYATDLTSLSAPGKAIIKDVGAGLAGASYAIGGRFVAPRWNYCAGMILLAIPTFMLWLRLVVELSMSSNREVIATIAFFFGAISALVYISVTTTCGKKAFPSHADRFKGTVS